MTGRVLLAVVSLSASLAAAQVPDTSPPPLIPLTEAPPPPAPSTAPRSCRASSECGVDELCTDFREIAPGKWSEGTCMPTPARRAQLEAVSVGPGQSPLVPLPNQRGDRPARFKYSGTVPEGFELVSQPRWSLVTAGTIVLGASYAAWALLSAATGAFAGLVPLAGPLLSLATSSLGSGFGILLFGPLAVIDTVAQVAGLTLLIIGFAGQDRWLERRAPPVSLVPTLLPGGAGLSLTSRF